jgi:phage shock protein C
MSESERPGEQHEGEPAVLPETQPALEQAEPGPEPHADAAATGPRRLVRSRKDKVIAGVCGGLGEYLGVDAVLIRIAALILIFAGGAGLILYVIGWIAMPEAPVQSASAAHATPSPTTPGERTTGAVVIGALFVLIGIFFLLDEAFPDFLSWNWIWPVALIAVGAIVILRARR